MKGFIFAAGFGERLKPLTETVPKPLVTVAGIPAICYSIALLKEAGISSVTCNLHYLHEKIIQFFSDNRNFGIEVNFSIEENILGTGGGLKRCEKFLNGDDFILMNCDSISDIFLPDLIDRYAASGTQGIACLIEEGEPGAKATTAVKNGTVADFNNLLHTGLPMEYDYMGAGIFSPLIFKYLHDGYSGIVETGYTGLIRDFTLGAHIHRGFWMDVGTLDSLKSADIFLKKRGSELMKRVYDNTGISHIR